MNYQNIYDRLMNRGQENRVFENGYFETHHIIPRCLGGSDDPSNLTRLSPEEHYVAHQLLVKLNPGHAGLIWAATLMTKGASGRQNNKLFGWLRRRMVQAKTGVPRPPEVIEALRKANEGRKRGPRSEETKRKIGEANRGKVHTDEMKRHLSEINKGKTPSLEVRQKMREGWKKRGTQKSPEHIRKIEESKRRNRELKRLAKLSDAAD
jgi:hypothetical protein